MIALAAGHTVLIAAVAWFCFAAAGALYVHALSR